MTTGNVYVIFGTTSGFPDPLPASGALTSWFNGSNGFYLVNAGTSSLALGDVDGDGLPDIVMGGGKAEQRQSCLWAAMRRDVAYAVFALLRHRHHNRLPGICYQYQRRL